MDDFFETQSTPLVNKPSTRRRVLAGAAISAVAFPAKTAWAAPQVTEIRIASAGTLGTSGPGGTEEPPDDGPTLPGEDGPPPSSYVPPSQGPVTQRPVIVAGVSTTSAPAMVGGEIVVALPNTGTGTTHSDS